MARYEIGWHMSGLLEIEAESRAEAADKVEEYFDSQNTEKVRELFLSVEDHEFDFIRLSD